jgi:aryl sulfotransferase
MTGKLILLSSYPKSGNTWVRAFLTSAWRDGSDVKLNQLMVPSVSSRQFIDAIIGIRSADLGNDELARLRPDIYDFASSKVRSGKRLFLKVHDAYAALSQEHPIPILEENIYRIVYLIRDPRDVAPSLSRHLGVPLDDAIRMMGDPAHRLSNYPWRPGNQVTHLVSSWSEHVKSWACRAAGPPICVVRFEDLVAAPHATFTTMVTFLNLRLAESVVSTAIEATHMSVLQRKEAAGGFSEKPPGTHRFFHEGRPTAWQSTLTAAQAASIEKDHGDMMTRFGYMTR